MDRIRLIASDMDATLLDANGQLPPGFVPMVKELARRDSVLWQPADGRCIRWRKCSLNCSRR